MINALIVLLSGCAIVFMCVCRIDLSHGRWVGLASVLGYVPLAMWALARALEVAAGEPHTWTDAGGLFAVAVHMVCVDQRWINVERRSATR